jgi:N-acetylneuraminic acid mutarotase
MGVFGGADSNNNPLSTAEVYDLFTNTWFTGDPMPTGRVFAAAAKLSTLYIAVVGGWNGNHLDINEVYLTQWNFWSVRAPMPSPRSRMAAVGLSAGNGMLVIGGENDTSSYLNTNELYEASGGPFAWSAKTPMPTGRRSAAAVLLNLLEVAVFGGEGALGEHLDTTEIYDSFTNTWLTGAPMPTPRSRLAAVFLDNDLAGVFGGVSFGSPTDQAQRANEVYDRTTNTWSTKAIMPTGRKDMVALGADYWVAAVVGGDLAINHPYTHATNVNEVYVYRRRAQ